MCHAILTHTDVVHLFTVLASADNTRLLDCLRDGFTSSTPSLACCPACRGRPLSTSGLCWNSAHSGGRMGGCCICRWKATCNAITSASEKRTEKFTLLSNHSGSVGPQAAARRPQRLRQGNSQYKRLQACNLEELVCVRRDSDAGTSACEEKFKEFAPY